MRASTWPFLTLWPSVNSTSASTPPTCGTSVAVTGGVTVPSASISTGRSPCTARAEPTVTPPPGPRPPNGPPGPPGPPLPGPPGPPAVAATGVLARCTRYQAPPTSAPMNSSTISTESHERRRRGGGLAGMEAPGGLGAAGSCCGSVMVRSGKKGQPRPGGSARASGAVVLPRRRGRGSRAGWQIRPGRRLALPMRERHRWPGRGVMRGIMRLGSGWRTAEGWPRWGACAC